MTDEASTTTWETLVEQYRDRAKRDDARIDELRQSIEDWQNIADMFKRQRNMAEEDRQIIRKNMDDLIVSVDVAMAYREAALRAECEAAKQSAAAAAAERDDVIAICRGTQLDDAAIHSMRGYVTEKLRVEAECEALRKDAALLREFVSSDEIAMTYQTMGQYRAALLKFHTAALAVQPTTGGEDE